MYNGDLPSTIELSLSPGDLDEAVRVFVTFEGRGVTTAFERVRAFRTGFDGGTDACLSTSGDRPSVSGDTRPRSAPGYRSPVQQPAVLPEADVAAGVEERLMGIDHQRARLEMVGLPPEHGFGEVQREHGLPGLHELGGPCHHGVGAGQRDQLGGGLHLTLGIELGRGRSLNHPA